MKLKIRISKVQSIKELVFEPDLSISSLIGIVGRNGIGKTTLARSLKNLHSSDTFTKTSSPYIFSDDSYIEYTIDDLSYRFTYNSKLSSLDTKELIDDSLRKKIHVELSIPHGERFNHFQRLSDIDDEIRKKIALEDFSEPTDLIYLMSSVYSSDRFNNLKEVRIKGKKYYFILKEDSFYIREDYLSSSEYFIINLYKIISNEDKVIFIDEIEISLDPYAQVRLIKHLRTYCDRYNSKIIFTTHSLALIKTLNSEELHLIEHGENSLGVTQRSYNYIKSQLFGFTGWDKYILVEDDVAQDYISYLITSSGKSFYSRYKIIYVGGGSQVTSLMKRNAAENFLSEERNVIAILDGDQVGLRHCRNNNRVLYMPFQYVEWAVKNQYDSDPSIPRVERDYTDKKTYESLLKTKSMTKESLFEIANRGYEESSSNLFMEIEKFLNDT